MNRTALNEARWAREDDPRKVVLTPSWLVDRIRTEIFGGAIDLDPATTPENPVGARTFVTPPENGLLVAWSGNVFLNPPWGATIGHWVERAILTGGGGLSRVILLAPARTDARWFQRAASTCDDLLIFGRRLDYHRPNVEGRRVRGARGGLMASVLFGFGVSTRPLADLGTVVTR